MVSAGLRSLAFKYSTAALDKIWNTVKFWSASWRSWMCKKKITTGFPKVTKSVQTGKVGVDAVSSIVNDELKWLFRKNHSEDDFGIDGYIDVVLDDGSVTGQSIAVQIKCGKTFFQNKNKYGYVFHGERKHLNYYLNNPLPILIVLCDPETRICYWERFEPLKTEGTEAGWKMVVPHTNILSGKSKKSLLDIVGPPADYIDKLERHWIFSESLKTAQWLHYAVSRSSIETCDIVPICAFFDRIQLNSELCEHLQGRVEVSISGYGSDTRELWEIPEVRQWFEVAEPAVKYWFYFLTTDSTAQGLKVLLTCLCNTQRTSLLNSEGTPQLSLDSMKMAQIFERNFIYLNEMTDRLGMPLERNKQISFAIMDLFKVPHE